VSIQILPSDSTRTWDEGELTSEVEGYRWIPVPKCDGLLDGRSSIISSIAINPGGRGRPLGP